MRVLLLSAYDAPSHTYWRSGLYQMFPEWEWTSLCLPPRHFNWRIRGNPLSWYGNPALNQPYDLIIATSMVDAASIRGINPALAAAPWLLYFHENQFAYPFSDNSRPEHSIEPKMVQIYSAISADACVFNSDYNRKTFCDGAAALLQRFPDEVPSALLYAIEKIKSKESDFEGLSCCIPVSLFDNVGLASSVMPSKKFEPNQASPLEVVWNHRWEYDKGPERLLAFIEALPRQYTLKFHILGQAFRKVPEAFDTIRAVLEERAWLGQWGFVEGREDYLAIIRRSHIVLSTSLHDFQGLSVLEGVKLGCIPLLPERLVYPEYFDKSYLYESHADVVSEAANMARAFEAIVAQLPALAEGIPNLDAMESHNCRASYLKLLKKIDLKFDTPKV